MPLRSYLTSSFPFRITDPTTKTGFEQVPEKIGVNCELSKKLSIFNPENGYYTRRRYVLELGSGKSLSRITNPGKKHRIQIRSTSE
jgi:hypothetical protein